jgi:hypothetical protein
MTKVNDLLLCSHPVRFENLNEKEYIYSDGGSCFVVFYGKDYYLITAKHVLNGYLPEQLSVLIDEKADDLIPFNLKVEPEKRNISSSEYEDITVFRIEKALLTFQQLNSLNALDLDKFKSIPSNLNKDDKLLFTGYPGHNRGINYEKQILKAQRVSMEGIYMGKYAEDHFHRLKVIDLGGVTTFDQFSGSPVLKYKSTNNGKYNVSFAGMALRGSLESQTIYFVDALIIYSILDSIENKGKN